MIGRFLAPMSAKNRKRCFIKYTQLTLCNDYSNEKRVAQMENNQNLQQYKEAYERERQKGRMLTARLSENEARAADLEANLKNIKRSTFWRISKPFREVYHWLKRTKQRLGRYGSLRGILQKLDSKRIERAARAGYGTKSFPSPEEAQRQRAYYIRVPEY